MEQINRPISERALFVAGVTFLGGFLDAYTYMTRGGVFANNHTGNMAKFGIQLAKGDLSAAWNCLIPMLACVLGAAASEWVKHRASKGREWRKNALLAELLALLLAAFLPAAVPDGAVNAVFSFITGFQLCLFRTGPWGAHNTTICTGNLRSVGQFLYAALAQRDKSAWSRLAGYTTVVFTFALGAGVGVPLCLWLGDLAALAGCLVAGGLLAALLLSDRQIVAVCCPVRLAKGR